LKSSVVRGDIGRQNTIFKFYLQSWFMLAVSAAAAFAWTFPSVFRWLPGWRAFWQGAMIVLVSGAAMYHRQRHIRQDQRPLDPRSPAHARFDDVHAICSI
jgi:uncharacterized membrane protein